MRGPFCVKMQVAAPVAPPQEKSGAPTLPPFIAANDKRGP